MKEKLPNQTKNKIEMQFFHYMKGMTIMVWLKLMLPYTVHAQLILVKNIYCLNFEKGLKMSKYL